MRKRLSLTVKLLLAVVALAIPVGAYSAAPASADSSQQWTGQNGNVYFWFKNPSTGVQVQKAYSGSQPYFDAAHLGANYENQAIQIRNMGYTNTSIDYVKVFFGTDWSDDWFCVAPGQNVKLDSGPTKYKFLHGPYTSASGGYGVDIFNHVKSFRWQTKAQCS